MFESRRPDITAGREQVAGLRLVVGDLRVDPASLVAFTALVRAGAEPALEVVAPDAPDRAARVAAVSPTSRLPVLVEHGTVIWEPLAILEWAAERAPGLWPAHARRRAVARAVVAELHGGFGALRQQLPFDWFARCRLRGEAPAAVQVDLHRLMRLWGELLDDGDGFLFGPRAGLADLAMVPMAARLRSYELWPREPIGAAYAERLLTLDEVAHAFAELAPEPALAKPPALALPIAASAAPAAAAPEPGAPSAPAGAGAAGGPRKLEEVVARARQREQRPPSAGAGPEAARPPPSPSPRPAEPASTSPPSPAPAPPSAGHEDAPAPTSPRARPAATPPGRGGLSWLRGGGRGEPPGGGRRRRPPGKR